MRTIGFTGGEKRLDDTYKEDIGQYRIIEYNHGCQAAGKIVDVDKIWIYLNPVQMKDWSQPNGQLRLVDRSQRIKKETIMSVTETTEEDILAYCEYQNRKDLEKRLEKKSQNPSQ